MSRGVAARWYDFGNLYQAFYEPTGDYSAYSKRLTEVFTGLGLNFPRRQRGTRLLRWFELEHTLPQRWFKNARAYLRVWTNTPVLLIPLLPWINTPLLEGKSPLWTPIRSLVSQPVLSNGIRTIYTPLTITGLAAGTVGAFYGSYQVALGWWNGPSGAPPPPLSQEL